MIEDWPMLEHKAALIKRAYTRHPFRSFADLGACWGVNGGYAIYARELCGTAFDRGFVADQIVTPLTHQRIGKWPDLFAIQSMLGAKQTRERVGQVDALIMFDILLHQANPAWDCFIKDWIGHAVHTIIVYNQNWFKDQKSQRFIERGLDWYLQNVFHNHNPEGLRKWFANHEQFNTEQGVLERDVHHWWQWGITPSELVEAFRKNDFDLVYLDTFDVWMGFPWIVNQGMIFERSKFPKKANAETK